MRSLFVAATFGLLTAFACADTRYYAVYLHDVRIGYYSVTTSSDTYEGKPAIRTETHFEDTFRYVAQNTNSIGQKVHVTRDTIDFASLDNRPIREQMTGQVDGRTNWQCDLKFGEKSAEINQKANGRKLHTTLPLPSSPIYYDEPALIAQKCSKPGDSMQVPTFNAGLGVQHPSFVSSSLQTVGYSNLNVEGQMVRAIVCEEKNSDSTVQNLYIGPSGEELRIEYPEASIVFARTSKEFALSPIGEPLMGPFIKCLAGMPAYCDAPTKAEIDNVDQLDEMRVSFQNFDLSAAPSDESQTIMKGDLKGSTNAPENTWSVRVYPPQIADSIPVTIGEALKGQEQWTKPEMFMPSDDPKMKALAEKIVGKAKTVVGAILAIKNYVGHQLRPKAEFGVPCDAAQILHDRIGTCSDYSILTVTLLRAAGIASRAVSGLITSDPFVAKDHMILDTHGWAEAWDGRRWIGVDATDRHAQLSANHVKLWEGGVESRLDSQMPDMSKATATIAYSRPPKW